MIKEPIPKNIEEQLPELLTRMSLKKAAAQLGYSYSKLYYLLWREAPPKDSKKQRKTARRNAVLIERPPADLNLQDPFNVHQHEIRLYEGFFPNSTCCR